MPVPRNTAAMLCLMLTASIEFCELAPFVHAFSHYRLNVTPLAGQVDSTRRIADTTDSRWLYPHEAAALGLPAPVRKPPEFWLPAERMSIFVPMLAICCCTCCCAPCPTLTMAITAATPMMMPSMVSAERSLLRASARIAMRRI